MPRSHQLSHLSSQAGLFSAVSSAFVIDVHSKLQPDPNEQSVALLRAILLTLNQSAIPGEAPTVPPAQEDSPSEIVTVTGLMYASLLISLLAAFVAMLGKQWLNRYLRNSGGSMIERCGDRQRKCDGLKKWPLHFFVESLPMMLQVALFLLTCGLCHHMWSINTSVACTLISLTGVGVVFYLAILIAGTSSYACPFQTPVSIALRSPWKKVRRRIVSAISWTRRMWKQRVRSLFRRQSPPTIPLENVQVQRSEPWLGPKDLAIIHRTNANDVRCVSWILRSITDPEALDAAIRLAGTIRWFEDGTNVDPPYDIIVSTFGACFDSTGKVYPGSRDRAYYSGRAMLWIRTLAMCQSEEFAKTFPLPTTRYPIIVDLDLNCLLQAIECWSAGRRFAYFLIAHPGNTPSHLQWISNVLLHLAWANRTTPDFEHFWHHIPSTDRTALPLDAILNRLLAWCISLGSPVEEEALKVQDKSCGISHSFPSRSSLLFTSDRLENILHRLSEAIVSAIDTARPQREFIPYVLCDLNGLENRPWYLTKMAYEWCSVICENSQGFRGWECLLFSSLEFGFRHLNPRDGHFGYELTHTEHHQKLVDVVFKSQKSEVIADLLHAWTAQAPPHTPAHALLSICTEHLVGLHGLGSFPSRLRRLVLRSIEVIGFKGFEEVGVERFVGLLNHLHVAVEDIDEKYKWVELLLDTLQSSEGAQHLSLWYWELLVELAVSYPWWLRHNVTYSPQIMTFLTEAQEWSKLECWMRTVWVVWPPGDGGMLEEDISCTMLLLFRQRPGAAQRLEQWIGRWSQERDRDMPESFQRIFKQAHEEAQRNAR